MVLAVAKVAVPPVTMRLPLVGALSEAVGAMFRSPKAPLTSVPPILTPVVEEVGITTPVRSIRPLPSPLIVRVRAVASLDRLTEPERVSTAPSARLL